MGDGTVRFGMTTVASVASKYGAKMAADGIAGCGG